MRTRRPSRRALAHSLRHSLVRQARDVTTIDLYLDAERIKTITVPASALHDGIGVSSNVTLCPSFDGRVTNYISFGRALPAEDISSLFGLYEDVGIADFGADKDQADNVPGGLSAGAIAGIVIVSVVCGGLLAAVAVLLYNKKNANREGDVNHGQDGSMPRRAKDSNVVMPDDDGGDDAAGERSLRKQFSYEYSPSDLSGRTLSRQFSYEYQDDRGDDDRGGMLTANPTFVVSD